MKKSLLLCCLFFLAVGLQAKLNFVSGEKYRIVCNAFSGTVALGSAHNSNVQIYYYSGTWTSDCFWTIEETTDGYVFQNVATQQYLTYTQTYNSTEKYLGLTATLSATCYWDIAEKDGAYTITSSAVPTMSFNLRTDGSRLVGCYSNANGFGSNSLFTFYDSEGNLVSENGTSATSSLESHISNLTFNGKKLIYDQQSNSYLFSLPESLRGGKDWEGTIAFTANDSSSDYVLLLNNTTPDSEGKVTIPQISCSAPYALSLQKGGAEVATSEVNFTFLPIVSVNVIGANSGYYVQGTIHVSNADRDTEDDVLPAKFKYRGATASNYAKKAYAIKILDENGESRDKKFLGMRDDNNWILDAMAIDKANMRNRVSTDLWNDFSTKPYHYANEPKALSGTRGRFVELVLNGQYHGLYCFTEKMDRKQLKLKKLTAATDSTAEVYHGSLYKSYTWTYEVFMGHQSDSRVFPGTIPSTYNNNNQQETWAGYEIKYPDYETESIDWGPLWNGINFVAKTPVGTTFDTGFATYFDLPVVLDYYLFLELMLATDNHGKNMFYFNYDKQATQNAEKLGIAVWDLDGTWGRRWDSSSNLTGASQDFTTFLWANEHGTLTYFHKLAASPTFKWKEKLAARYAELRPTFFNPDTLSQRFTTYANLFQESKADSREENAWPSYHWLTIQDDVNYIKQWIQTRVAYLDNYYGYDATGISPIATTDDYLAVAGKSGSIAINCSQPRTIRIYTAGGQLVRTAHLTQTFTELTGFSAGVYIVAGKKVIVTE